MSRLKYNMKKNEFFGWDRSHDSTFRNSRCLNQLRHNANNVYNTIGNTIYLLYFEGMN